MKDRIKKLLKNTTISAGTVLMLTGMMLWALSGGSTDLPEQPEEDPDPPRLEPRWTRIEPTRWCAGSIGHGDLAYIHLRKDGVFELSCTFSYGSRMFRTLEEAKDEYHHLWTAYGFG